MSASRDEERIGPITAEAPSKSERKRRHLALQDLVQALAGLPEAALARAMLPGATLDAIREVRRLSRTARQRQVRFAAKRIAEDADEEALEALRSLVWADADTRRREAASLHRLERWRERLLESGDEALTGLVEAYPGIDRTHVRQLVRRARTERERDRPPVAFRKLLRYLREVSESEEAG